MARWKKWNAGIEIINMHRSSQAGTTFTMQPPGQDARTSSVVEVTPTACFSDQLVVGATRVVVSHTLVPLSSGGTKLISNPERTGQKLRRLGQRGAPPFLLVRLPSRGVQSRRSFGRALVPSAGPTTRSRPPAPPRRFWHLAATTMPSRAISICWQGCG